MPSETCAYRMRALQDRSALAPLQEPPDDDLRRMLESAIEDISASSEGHDPDTNLLEARLWVCDGVCVDYQYRAFGSRCKIKL